MQSFLPKTNIFMNINRNRNLYLNATRRLVLIVLDNNVVARPGTGLSPLHIRVEQASIQIISQVGYMGHTV